MRIYKSKIYKEIIMILESCKKLDKYGYNIYKFNILYYTYKCPTF